MFVVARTGWFQLGDLPTVGNDGQLGVVSLVVGVLLGSLRP